MVIFLLSSFIRIWEHLSSHRGRPDLLHHLRPAGDSSLWIPAGRRWRSVGDDLWEGHRQSGEDDCGEMLCLHQLIFDSEGHLQLTVWLPVCSERFYFDTYGKLIIIQVVKLCLL